MKGLLLIAVTLGALSVHATPMIEGEGWNVTYGQPGDCARTPLPSLMTAEMVADQQAQAECAQSGLYASRISDYSGELIPSAGCTWTGMEYKTPMRRYLVSAQYECLKPQTP